MSAVVSSTLFGSTERALAHRVAVAQRDGRGPSVVAGVQRDGTLAWSGGSGRVEGEDASAVAYRIGSITKTFTAVLVMALRDEGRLELTDPISAYLPEVGGVQTLAQLLTHSSGLTSELPGVWFERVPGQDFPSLVAGAAQEATRMTPGSRLHYSNLAFGLLGEVVGRVAGTSWFEELERRLLIPLELTRTGTHPVAPAATGWAVHPHADVVMRESVVDLGAMAPAGQLWSTVADLTRWLAFLTGDGDGLVRAATLEEMRHPAVVADGASWSSGFGLGIQLRRVHGRRLMGHGGSVPGFVAGFWADQDTRDGAVVLANATSCVDTGSTALDLLQLLAQHEPAWPRAWSPVEIHPNVLELTGTWFWGPTPFTLSFRGKNILHLAARGGGRDASFHSSGADTWTGLDGYYAGEKLQVVRGTDGTVSHLDLATFVYTRQAYEPAAAIPGSLDPSGWHQGWAD